MAFDAPMRAKTFKAADAELIRIGYVNEGKKDGGVVYYKADIDHRVTVKKGDKGHMRLCSVEG